MAALFAALVDRFEREEATLNALDAAIGDGDHGTTILRGLRAARDRTAAASGSPGEILLDGAAAFQRATGGAGGILFSQIFSGLGNAAGASPALDLGMVARGLSAASAGIQKLGRTKLGAKTMLDAIEPASTALAGGGSVLEAVRAARIGMEATRDMSATLGRARFVADGGRGHIDPGAQSVVVILEELERLFGPNFGSGSAP